jgi:hypothetical protein
MGAGRVGSNAKIRGLGFSFEKCNGRRKNMQ